jgi:mannosyltransferase OCH1-like enzyme
MIPKIIHYCWFGPKTIPETEQKCIESWHKFFFNYDFKFWNEDTFDFDKAPLYAKHALEYKKYAFVSDYVRVKALEEYGGIYLDTDVEVLNSFDKLVAVSNNFLGFETRSHLGTAVMAFAPHHSLMKDFVRYYEKHDFIDKKGRKDYIANVTILTDLLAVKGLVSNGRFQTLDDITIYPREYFYPKKLSDTEFRNTPETHAIHRCSNSWMTERQKKRGRNKFWLHIFRPMLQIGRKIGIKLIGIDKLREIEIIIRDFLK